MANGEKLQETAQLVYCTLCVSTCQTEEWSHPREDGTHSKEKSQWHHHLAISITQLLTRFRLSHHQRPWRSCLVSKNPNKGVRIWKVHLMKRILHLLSTTKNDRRKTSAITLSGQIKFLSRNLSEDIIKCLNWVGNLRPFVSETVANMSNRWRLLLLSSISASGYEEMPALLFCVADSPADPRGDTNLVLIS